MKLARDIGGSKVTLSCSPQFEQQGRSVLDLLATLDAKGPRLDEGTRVELGWSVLTLRRVGDELVVGEPFFLGDPSHEELPDIDTTLRVLTEQTAVLARVGAVGATARFDQRVALAKGCLDEDRIYLERRPPTGASDSGWYIGPVAGAEPETVGELETRAIHQLLAERDSLMQVLALPVGYLVVFDGHSIEAILDEAEVNRWK